MHRPGIASVQGDRIVLDGTTIDELERYHLKTLKLVVRQLNERTGQYVRTERERVEAAQQAAADTTGRSGRQPSASGSTKMSNDRQGSVIGLPPRGCAIRAA